MSTLYPVGYGHEKVSMAEMRRRHEGHCHPEFARRLFAWIESKNGAIGIGGGWRPTPSNTSAASRAGHSFHQDQHFASGFVGIDAVDLVHVNGSSVHRAPHWNEVPKQGSGHPDIAHFGIHANVANEPWHVQATPLDGWQTWVSNGRHDPPHHAISGVPNAAPSEHHPQPGWPPFDPIHGKFSLWPLGNKHTLHRGAHEAAVAYLQGVILNKAGGHITVDSWYGDHSVVRVKDLQGVFDLAEDGVVGPKTWGAIDYLANL